MNRATSCRSHHFPLTSYQALERRQLLATITVDTALDDGGATADGLISLREAIIAANTNTAFGDAPAGDADGDKIFFDASLEGATIGLLGSGLSITEGVEIRSEDIDVTVDSDEAEVLFDINTDQQVIFNGLTLLQVDPESEARGINMSGGGELRLTDTRVEGFGFFPGASPAVTVTGSSLELIRSTFGSNGNGAIEAESSNVAVYSSEFNNNSKRASGAGIAMFSGQLTVSDTLFTRNSTVTDTVVGGGGNGAAISIGTFATARINGGSFLENVADNGGAIGNSGRLFLRNGTLFEGNRAIDVFAKTSDSGSSQGGAISSFNNMTIVDAVFRDNRADDGGAIHVSRGQNLINGTLITEGFATRGGGLRASGGFTTILDSTIEGNRAYVGGGLFAASTERSELSIYGGQVSGNRAIDGGGIYSNDEATVGVFARATIEGNEARFSDEEGRGGAIYAAGNTTLLNSVTVRGNTAVVDGGAIHLEKGFLGVGRSTITANRAGRNGGGINMDGGQARFWISTIGGDSIEEGNFAGEFRADGTRGVGGGINIAAESGDSRLIMMGGKLGFNTAKISGGGIHAEGAGNVVRMQFDVEVTGNRAFAGDGGGIYNFGSHMEIRDSVFSQNKARNGAGLYLGQGPYNSGSANLTSVTFQQNEARRTGGGIFKRTFMNLRASNFIDNTATFFPDFFDKTTS